LYRSLFGKKIKKEMKKGKKSQKYQ